MIAGTAVMQCPALCQVSLRKPSRAHLRRAYALRPRPSYASRREQPRESRAAGITGRMRPRPPGSRRCGVAASLASFGRKPYGRGGCRAQLPRHRPAAGPRRNAPDPTPHEQDQAVTLMPGADRRMKVTATGTGTPRIVQVGPSSVKGTPKILSNRFEIGSSGPTLERRSRSLCRPSGPDGEGQARGQARNARGEPHIAQVRYQLNP